MHICIVCVCVCVIFSEFYDEDDEPPLYREVSGILHALKEKGIEMAVASRTPTPKVAYSFLQKLGFDSIFVAKVTFFFLGKMGFWE